MITLNIDSKDALILVGVLRSSRIEWERVLKNDSSSEYWRTIATNRLAELERLQKKVEHAVIKARLRGETK